MKHNNMTEKHNFKTSPVIVFIIAIFFMSAIMYLMYFYNNKYHSPDLGSRSFTFLIDNWDYFPGHLYTPDNTPENGKKITVGEVPNHQKSLGTPYGTATYRLRFEYHDSAPALTIQIPEVPSSCSVYINGKYYGGSGDVRPEHYKPLIRDLTFSFPALEENEILIQTANYSHYYSGLYYPLVLGSADALNLLSSLRLLTYAVLLISALTVGIFGIFSWTGPSFGRQKSLLALGALNFAFVLYISYPFFRIAGIPSVSLLYALEDTGGFIVILCTGVVTSVVCNLSRSIGYRRLFLPCAAGACIFSFSIPLFILPTYPGLTAAYGIFISCGKLLLALLLTAGAFCGAYRKVPGSLGALFAVTVFGAGLFYEVFSIGAYEPIIAGWPQEIGAYAMVLTFACASAANNRRIMLENKYLNTHLKEEVDKKTASLNSLLDERKKILSSIAHDMKTPLTAIHNYLQLLHINPADTCFSTNHADYLNAALGKTRELKLRLDTLQELSSEDIPSAVLVPTDLTALLEEFHKINLSDIELEGQHFVLSVPEQACMVLADRELLVRALENLCYNALSFTPAGGTISLNLNTSPYTATITVSDNGSGILPEVLPHIFEYGYSKRTGQSGNGLGLFITKTIILEHQGYIFAASTPGISTVFTIELPLYLL